MTDLVLLVSPKFGYQAGEWVLATYGRDLGVGIVAEYTEAHEAQNSDREPASCCLRGNNGNIGTPHGEHLLLLVELPCWALSDLSLSLALIS